MIHPKQTSVPFRSLLFHLTNIELIDRPIGWISERQTVGLHTLLVFINGKGNLHLNNEPFRFAPDKCYLLSPGTSLQVEDEYDTAICFYQITFTVIQVGNPQHTTYTGYILPDRYEVTMYPLTRLIRLIETLYIEKDCAYDIEWFHQHLRFQQLMGFLLEHNLHSEHLMSSTLITP